MHQLAAMIIACPECATRYVIGDEAVGTGGRTIRCANCRHSWFQGPASVDTPHAEGLALTMAQDGVPVEDRQAPSGDGARLADDEGGEGAAFSQDMDDAPIGVWDQAPDRAPAEGGDEPFAEQVAVAAVSEGERQMGEPGPPARSPRRGSMRLWAGVAVGFAAAVLAIVGAASVWGMPEWVPIGRSAQASAHPDLVLRFPMDRQDRRTLANGTEFFGASGSITNTGQETRRVPPILILLRDDSDRIVYRWEVTPPKTALAPGESVTINEAVTNVPESARHPEIGWKSG